MTQIAGSQGSIECNRTTHVSCVVRAIRLTQAPIVHLQPARDCSVHCLHQRGTLGKAEGMLAISHPYLSRLPVPWAEPGRGMISSTDKVFTAASKQTSNMHKVQLEEVNYTLKQYFLKGRLISPGMLHPCKNDYLESICVCGYDSSNKRHNIDTWQVFLEALYK